MRAGSGPRRAAVLATALALVLVTGACGQVEDPGDPTSPSPVTFAPESPTDASPTTTGDETTDGTGTASPGGTGTATGTATSTATETVEPTDPDEDFLAPEEVATSEQARAPDLVVTGVRLGSHEGFDRVVLDLDGTGTVGWRVLYEDQPTLDGSGAPVDLAGTETLVVTLVGTRLPEPGEDLYDPGQLLVRGSGLSVVTEVLRAAPFEGQLATFIGTRERAPFRVFALQDPARLVIDVATP